MQTLGEMLVEARKAAGVSAFDVSQATRIMPAAIAALEADDYAALPAPGYVRGYILSYCKYVGATPDEFLATYEKRTGYKRSESTGRTPIDTHADKYRGPEHEISPRVVVAIVLVIVVIGAVVWWGSGLLKKRDTIPPLPQTTEGSTQATASAQVQTNTATFDFTIKPKEGKASRVKIVVDGVEAFDAVLTGDQKESYKDISRAELTIKKPKNVTVTQNGTNIPVPTDGKLTLSATAD
ncbi:MAG: helix-turn-helix domain-containing protein [Actinomycetes bacterium]|jgi:cytoskeletal protein RodZ|nr:helix-turn-helix domain-containing protein [Actinomycetes bacterium]